MSDAVDMGLRYIASGDTVESQLGEETVVLHLGSGVYFGLDPVGALVWERLKEGDTPAGICDHVRASFADVPETVGRDVTAFLQQLAENDLIAPA